MNQHIQTRLNQRDLSYTPAMLAQIAKEYTDDTAVILGKRNGGINFGMVLIILIVRNSLPITIMERRQSQNFTTKNFNVTKIVYRS